MRFYQTTEPKHTHTQSELTASQGERITHKLTHTHTHTHDKNSCGSGCGVSTAGVLQRSTPRFFCLLRSSLNVWAATNSQMIGLHRYRFVPEERSRGHLTLQRSAPPKKLTAKGENQPPHHGIPASYCGRRKFPLKSKVLQNFADGGFSSK